MFAPTSFAVRPRFRWLARGVILLLILALVPAPGTTGRIPHVQRWCTILATAPSNAQSFWNFALDDIAPEWSIAATPAPAAPGVFTIVVLERSWLAPASMFHDRRVREWSIYSMLDAHDRGFEDSSSGAHTPWPVFAAALPAGFDAGLDILLSSHAADPSPSTLPSQPWDAPARPLIHTPGAPTWTFVEYPFTLHHLVRTIDELLPYLVLAFLAAFVLVPPRRLLAALQAAMNTSPPPPPPPTTLPPAASAS